MANTREYVIKPDGSINRRTISEAEVDVNDQLMAIMTRDVSFKSANLAYFDKTGYVGVTLLPTGAYATIALERLLIRAPWRLQTGGTLVPAFGSNYDPVVTVRWTPPPTCHLRLVVQVIPGVGIHGSSPVRLMHNTAGCWLFAADYRSNPPSFWRLPIANVHDDCSCCTGNDNGCRANSLLEAVRLAVDNFDQALYNADLWRDVEKTQSFFRVKPIENGNFEALAPTGDWTTYCLKVGNNITSYLA